MVFVIISDSSLSQWRGEGETGLLIYDDFLFHVEISAKVVICRSMGMEGQEKKLLDLQYGNMCQKIYSCIAAENLSTRMRLWSVNVKGLMMGRWDVEILA